MKRPRISDHAAERQMRRERAAIHAAAVFGCLALLLVGIQGGMLYDRLPTFEAVSWVSAVAVPLGALVVGLAVFVWALRDRRSAAVALDAPRLAGLATALLVLWTVLRLWGTPNLLSGLMTLGTLGLAVGIGTLLCAARRSPMVLSSAIVVLLLIGLFLSVIGLREYLTEWRAGNPGWRVFAGFAVPNFLAGMFVMILPITAALFVSVRDRLSALVLGFVLVLATLTMLLTQSRLGVAALAVAIVVFAAAAFRSGALQGVFARRAAVLLLVVAIAGAVGARPVVQRLRASRDQSYSARFRTWTWNGAQRIVLERPLTGAGTGSFDFVYPRYALVGYTQHAHNSFLQWACETGIPGVLFLLATLGASWIAGFRLLRTRPRSDWPLGDERLLVAGLMAGLAGAAAHNVFDSDLYVPANAVVLGTVCGLLVALHLRDEAAEGASASRRRLASLRRWAWAVPTAAGALVFTVLAGRLCLARMHLYAGGAALANQDVLGAAEAYRKAAAANPLDHEPRLALALIHDRLGEEAQAERELRAAVRTAPIGKTHYRLGRFLIARGRPGEAVRELEQARQKDPRNLRTLLALAEAYRASGRPAEADRIYRDMLRMRELPVGKIRAVPEVPDWEYGIAFAALAERALLAGRSAEAIPLLQDAERVLGELWSKRKDVMVRVRLQPDAMREAFARYEWVLQQLAESLQREKRHTEAEAVTERLRTFRRELNRETGVDVP